MTRCSHSKLRATDSQDFGRLDSFSLPSEPPDIGNWFSSYVYESPELNTLDGFQDFDGSGETFVEEGKKGKSGGSQPVGKSDDALLAASEKSSDGIKFNESDEFECSKSDALVTGSSESLSFSSEPPDIKNWFSSYIYESPPLDTTHDFAISDYKEREDGKLCNVQVSCRQDKKDVIAFVGAKERIELCSQSRHPDVVVKCTNLVKDTKLDYQSVSKDVHNVALKPTPSILSPMSMNVENNIGSLDGESVHKSIGRIDSVKDSLEKEHIHETVSSGTLDLTVPKGDFRERPTRSSNGKENEENELPENGFVSIRKKSSQGNVTRRVRVEVESLRNVVDPKINHEKDAKIVRKVLSEISNIQESSGKWRCPQKNKPDLGPPLKQLRLDQWFYRA